MCVIWRNCIHSFDSKANKSDWNKNTVCAWFAGWQFLFVLEKAISDPNLASLSLQLFILIQKKKNKKDNNHIVVYFSKETQNKSNLFSDTKGLLEPPTAHRLGIFPSSTRQFCDNYGLKCIAAPLFFTELLFIHFQQVKRPTVLYVIFFTNTNLIKSQSILHISPIRAIETQH